MTSSDEQLVPVEQRHKDAAAWALDKAPDSMTWGHLTAAHRTPDQLWQAHRVAKAFARFEAALRTPPAVEPDEGLVDLIRELKNGVQYTRLASDDATALFDIDYANEIMAHTAEILSTLTSSARVQWQPIETCELWAVVIVTDGDRVDIAQRAEDDNGGEYWAIEPVGCLDWEPTLWTLQPDDASPIKARHFASEARAALAAATPSIRAQALEEALEKALSALEWLKDYPGKPDIHTKKCAHEAIAEIRSALKGGQGV